MSLLPTFISKEVIASLTEEISSYQNGIYEWGVDFETGQLTGRMVDRKEHLKVWIWKCLMTERFRYPIYSWAYGSELEKYIGKVLTDEYLMTDVRLALEDALYINPDIKRIYNYTARMNADRLLISFDVDSVYGKINIVDFERDVSGRKAWYEAEKAASGIGSGAIRLEINDDGYLVLRKSRTTDRALRFEINSAGELVASMSKQFAQLAELNLNEATGELEAKVHV